jgi:hypothetical protein
MTYKLKNKFKYKAKRNYKYKTKTAGIQQIVNVNIQKSKDKKRRRKQQPKKKAIISNIPHNQIALNQAYTPTTINDTITSHKLGLLELQALETKNNIQDMINKAQLSRGAIEEDKYKQAIELLNERYRNIEEDFNDTRTQAGMIFGKLGESIQQLYGKLETKTLSPPRMEEGERGGSSSGSPPRMEEGERGGSSSGSQEEEEDKPQEEEEDKPQEEEEDKPQEEEEDKPQEEEKRTIYYGEKSMYSNLNKLIGGELSGRLRKYLTAESIDRKTFVTQMYADKPEIGYTEDTTERKELVIEYIETIMGIKKRGKKK